jgi:hypothetical protein
MGSLYWLVEAVLLFELQTFELARWSHTPTGARAGAAALARAIVGDLRLTFQPVISAVVLRNVGAAWAREGNAAIGGEKSYETWFFFQ